VLNEGGQSRWPNKRKGVSREGGGKGYGFQKEKEEGEAFRANWKSLERRDWQKVIFVGGGCFEKTERGQEAAFFDNFARGVV